jgi:hypothetical protein
MVVVHGIAVDRIPRRESLKAGLSQSFVGSSSRRMAQLAVGRSVEATSIATRSCSAMPPHTPYGSPTRSACSRQFCRTGAVQAYGLGCTVAVAACRASLTLGVEEDV